MSLGRSTTWSSDSQKRGRDSRGEMANELKALIENRTIRVLDLVVVTKAEDGSIEAAELRDVVESDIGEVRGLERDLATLLAEEDVEQSAKRWSQRAPPRCLSGKTAGPPRSLRRFAGRAVNWSPAAGSPRRRWSRRTAKLPRKKRDNAPLQRQIRSSRPAQRARTA